MAAYEGLAVRTGQSLSLLNMGQSFIITIGLIIVMVMSAIGVEAKTLTVGDFVMVNAYMIQITMPLNFLGTVYRSGKSTIGRLLFRFYDVTGGAIRIDGQDIRDVTQTSLHQLIGVVPQDTVLFNDTVHYNIAYGRADATENEIVAAAKAARIHDFIMSLPEGYATTVGERGLKLSGGEKQRVGIARTLLKNPPILVLDEATSALDTQTERSIQDSLLEMGQGRSVITIAHRLSTIADADCILVLEDGLVTERGRHEELLALDGKYAAMWARQSAEEDEIKAA